MKDAYSFDQDEAGARPAIKDVRCLSSNLHRCGLTFRAVEADTGLIGGSISHEFMVLADTGEEHHRLQRYMATTRRTSNRPNCCLLTDMDSETPRPSAKRADPRCRTVEEVTDYLKVARNALVKTLLYSKGRKTRSSCAASRRSCGQRGQDSTNSSDVTELELADSTPSSTQATGAPVGFAGPIGLKQVRIIADYAVESIVTIWSWAAMKRYALCRCQLGIVTFQCRAVCGSSQAPAPETHAPDDNDGTLKATKGIEVGHVFMLGTKYSRSDEGDLPGSARHERLAVMGCYGIGVGRTAASADRTEPRCEGHHLALRSRHSMSISSRSVNPPRRHRPHSKSV